jgi:putative ATPase
MRPASLEAYVGQDHIIGPGKPLTLAIKSDTLHSMVLWGPPGTGKTSLAWTIAQSTNAAFETLSAVTSGVKDIRAVMERALKRREAGDRTVLFVDEVHRFNKSQQDAFLPYIEDGTIVFIGATTENPAFELNRALLSRLRVYVIKPLDHAALRTLLQKAMDQDPILLDRGLQLSDEAMDLLVKVADGDARRALNLLEMIADLFSDEHRELQPDDLGSILNLDVRAFDRQGDVFYDQISALHKSVRGSDPDAAMYWLTRMLDGGCDGNYLARRILRMASEDIGNADPRALTIALDAWQGYERLGSPEGDLLLAQAVLYLAVAPKSNAVYLALKKAGKTVQQSGSLPVPAHLRNAPTRLAKELGHGDAYRYPHDEPGAFAPGVHYFPDELPAIRFYEPSDRGLEGKIRDKLNRLRALNEEHKCP